MLCSAGLSALTPEALEKVRAVESRIADAEQLRVKTHHLFHAGMYARTVEVPAGVALTGVLMRRATVLIVQGQASLFDGVGWLNVDGYAVLPGSAGRKQLMVTRSQVWMTMLFPTEARTVAEAEAEFTDEGNMLRSRTSTADTVVLTGE